MRKLFALVGVAAVSAGATSACDVSPYAAVVNGVTISQSSLDSELNAIGSNKQFVAVLQNQGVTIQGEGNSTYKSGFVARILSGRISVELVRQALAKRGITVTSDDLALARKDVIASFTSSGGQQSGVSSVQAQAIFSQFPPYYQEQLAQDAAELTALEASLAGKDVGRTAVQHYYDVHRSDFVVNCISDIMVASQADAQAISAQIAAGANFSDLARAHSQDSSRAGKGGFVGCIPSRGLSAALISQIDAIPAGGVSQPVQLGGAWHLIQVTQRYYQSLADASATIRQQLLSSASNKVEAGLQALQAKAKVTVNPQYGHFVPVGQQAGVIPPVGPPQSLLTLPGTTTSGSTGSSGSTGP